MTTKQFSARDCLVPILAAVLWWPGLTLAAGAGTDRPDEEQAVRVYREVVPATVFITSSFSSGSGRRATIGSGFLVDDAGTIVTNAHVVHGAHTVTVKMYDGQRVRAEVLGIDTYSDVAVLRLHELKGKVPFLRFGASDSLRIGQRTLVIGNPYGLGFGLSTGIISGLDRLPPGLSLTEARVPLIQTTAPINPGDSGGPLVASDGRVIGITTAMLSGTQNIGFAVPVNIVKDVAAKLKATGQVRRPWVGVGGKFVTEEIRELFVLPLADGLLVEEVYPGSPADDAGIQPGTVDVTVAGEPWMMGGDLIVSMQGQPIRKTEEFVALLGTLKIGDALTVELLRDRLRKRVSMVVGERPHALSIIVPVPDRSSPTLLPRAWHGDATDADSPVASGGGFYGDK
ncbi:S1C family serine protease [Nitrospira moscoviensis]|uniref:Putative Serine/cysteine peptidase, trypsin-like n=1 Tax=Nitrospira moscoviensis TaxID=42253 RepID=A0A0K2GFM0_NITMO|nr:trypsin-like peptidase domain-containing protein [Nitrospira moscoviensis]ALA59397.1 putative Serine/cysteine peptidase, trypsin-like [Nitrospira moscoviensis]